MTRSRSKFSKQDMIRLKLSLKQTKCKLDVVKLNELTEPYFGIWDIKVAKGTLAYLCNDAKLLASDIVYPPNGNDGSGNFITVRDTYFHIDELVGDYRKDGNPTDGIGYLVLELPKNDVAKYIVVSMNGTTVKNG